MRLQYGADAQWSGWEEEVVWDMRATFKAEDAVWVDASEYELTSPGAPLPGVVLAVTDDLARRYQVRVRLQLGSIIDLTVSAQRLRHG